MGNKILKYIYNLSVIFPTYTLFYLFTMLGIWCKNNELTNNRIIIFVISLIIVILFTIIIIYIFMYHIKIIPQINILIISANKKNQTDKIIKYDVIIPTMLNVIVQYSKLGNKLGLILIILLILIATGIYTQLGILLKSYLLVVFLGYNCYEISIEGISDSILLTNQDEREIKKINNAKRIFEDMFYFGKGDE